jgi:hypothetical protein
MELGMCQRYYETGTFSWIGCFTGAAVARTMVFYKVTKRIATIGNLTKSFSDGALFSATPSYVAADGDRFSIQFLASGASIASEISGTWNVSAEL